MKVHILRNDLLAPPGAIADWVESKNYTMAMTNVYEGESYPDQKDFDLLIILGGTPGAYEENKYSWLKTEKKFIYETIKNDKYVLGICLGAQMIAEVIGGGVYPMSFEELGWKKIFLTTEKNKKDNLFYNIPKEFTVFQYHGDTFHLPKDAELEAIGLECHNQMFSYGSKVIGTQFHPEFNINILKDIIKNSEKEISNNIYYTQEKNSDIYRTLIKENLIEEANKILFQLLNNLTQSS